MIRWFFATVLLSAGAIAAVWALTPKLTSSPTTTTPVESSDSKGPDHPQEQASLSSPTPASAGSRSRMEVVVYHNDNRPILSKPVIIPNGTLVIVEKQEVPSEKEGEIVFIGTEVRAGEEVPKEKQLPDAELGFLAVQISENEPLQEGEVRFHFKNDPTTWYRRVRNREDVPPLKGVFAYETRKVRKLQVGDRVQRGQLLALIDPRSAFDDVSMKLAKLDGVHYERNAAKAQKVEMHRQLLTQQELARRTPGAISPDEIAKTRVQHEKFSAEENVKMQEIVTAQRTLNDSLTKLKMHEIRAEIDGVIKAIYKNHQGDAVKPLEAIMRIENLARLRVEGRLELQEARNLEVGMTAIVEASRPESPHLVLSGHLQAVNCVAVSKGKMPVANGDNKAKPPVIVSGSEDETLRGWSAITGEKLWAVYGLRAGVRSVACSPPGAAHNLACFGCADGTIRILDLDNPDKKPREFGERHRGPVHSIAFSPDGQRIATGGDDSVIRLWNTASGSMLHTLANHSGPVTSVQFASAKRLVSAGKDFRLVVWDVETGKPPRPLGTRFEGRSGEVLTLGVSPDGKTVLFDQGKQLRLLTLEGKELSGSLHNSSEAWNFSTMALFSPDGKTILTNGTGSGRLQLWRTPINQPRGSELRQFIWTKGTATCGAFAPEDGSFAVTGTQDHQVLVWSMPSQEEIDKRLEARLTLVEKYLDTESRNVRVWAELDSPEWIVPGMHATMVVSPTQK